MAKGIINYPGAVLKCATELDVLSKQLNDCMQKLEKDTEILSKRHKDEVFVDLRDTMNIYILDLKKLSNIMEKYSTIVLKSQKITNIYLENSKIKR